MSLRYAYGLAIPHQLPDASGVAHVVEHLVGHGPKDRRSRYLLPELIDRGVLDSFTGLTYRDFTGYVFTGYAGTADATIDLIRQSCLDPAMDAEAIAVERGRPIDGGWHPGVVEDEGELRRSWLRTATSAAISAVYPGDALSHDPSGRPDLLRLLTADTIRSFHRDWYAAPSVIACRAAEGEPFEIVDNNGRSSWIWQPQTRYAALPVAREPGQSGVYVLCWRVGAFPSRQRRHNLLVARFIAVALGRRDTRHRLDASGWSVVAGPIVDSTLPDPCVIVVVQPPVGTCDPAVASHATAASDVIGGLLRSTVTGEDDLATLRALAERLSEPLVPEPWAARAVLALVDGLAAGSSRGPDISLDEIREAVLRCAAAGGHVGLSGQPLTFAVTRPPSAGEPLAGTPSAAGTPKVSLTVGYPVTPYRLAGNVPRRVSTRRSDESDLDSFEFVIGADSRRWPDDRMTISVRIYPFATPAWRARLITLAESWPVGLAVPPPRLRVSGTTGGPRPFAEWSLTAGVGQLNHALTGFTRAIDSIPEHAAPQQRPAAPDPFLVAASQAGSAEARTTLALHRYAVTGQALLPEPIVQPGTGLISIGVTGAGRADAGNDLWPAARSITHQLYSRIARLPAQSIGDSMSPIDVHRDECGHWWLHGHRQATGPPVTMYAVQVLRLADGDARVPDRGAMITDVREAMRDNGYYAIDGRIVEDWRMAVFTVHRASVDHIAATRLAEAVATATDRCRDHSSTVQPSPPECSPAATPRAAVEAVQRRLTESSLPPPGASRLDQSLSDAPTILIASAAGGSHE